MTQPQPSLETFVDRLLEEKGLANLDNETLVQAKKDLTDRLENRLNAAILEKMPPQYLEEFEKILDKQNEEETQAFCNEKIPNLPEILAAELAEFRVIYLNS